MSPRTSLAASPIGMQKSRKAGRLALRRHRASAEDAGVGTQIAAWRLPTGRWISKKPFAEASNEGGDWCTLLGIKQQSVNPCGCATGAVDEAGGECEAVEVPAAAEESPQWALPQALAEHSLSAAGSPLLDREAHEDVVLAVGVAACTGTGCAAVCWSIEPRSEARKRSGERMGLVADAASATSPESSASPDARPLVSVARTITVTCAECKGSERAHLSRHRPAARREGSARGLGETA